VENFFDFKAHLPVIVLNLFVHHHIRRPKSLCQNIPDLLDRLMDVEHVRQGLLEIYKQVETCQQACKSDAPNMCLLAANDEIEITTHSSDALDTAYRTLYSETVIGYSKLVSHLLPSVMIMLNRLNSTFSTSILGLNRICFPLIWRSSTLACAQKAQVPAHKKPSTVTFQRKNTPG
jgi:hypothetical protein